MKSEKTWDGRRLKTLRTKAGLSIRTLAEKSGIGSCSISHYEKNIMTPSIDAIVKLADYFAVSTEYFLGRLTSEDENSLEEAYGKYFMGLRKEAYEKYLFDRNKRGHATIGKYEFPYPYNLVRHIFGVPENSETFAYLSEDQLSGLDEAMASLKPRYKTIIRMYFEERRTMEEIGKDLFIVRERVRQLLAKALWCLRSGKNRLLIEYGLKGYQIYCEEQSINRKIRDLRIREVTLNRMISDCTKKENVLRKDYHINPDWENAARGLSVPLEKLDLSTRSYNALKLYFSINEKKEPRLSDVLELHHNGDLYYIRNLGEKSRMEIVDLLREEGCLAAS